MKSGKLIIIVDDDLEDQGFLKKAITEVNDDCEIISANDGTELMDMLFCRNDYKNKKIIPDFIILDLNMPLMDGYEVLKEIRNNTDLKHIPVYVLTTSEFEYDKIKAVAYGANAFFSKPFLYGDLVSISRRIFQLAESVSTLDKAG